MEIDASEYQPVVVELPSSIDSGTQENGLKEDNAEESKALKGESRGALGEERWSEEKRTGLWVELLDKRRQKYLASMTDEERRTFLEKMEM